MNLHEAQMQRYAGEAYSEITCLRADVEALKNALSPFAALLQEHHERMHDERPIFDINSATVTVGQLRAARAALKETPK
jgi:hypothetical protein